MKELFNDFQKTCFKGFLALVLVVWTMPVMAQTINGSVYNYFGVGNVQERFSAYNRSMGFTGVAVRDNFNINGINPASYNSIGKPFTSIFEMGGFYESTKHETSSASSVSKTGGLNGLNLLVKASPKFGFIIGASPISTISYNASESKSFPSLTIPTQVVHEGSGGINQFYFGGSFQVFKNFSLGANLAYYLGTIKKIDNIPSTQVTPQLVIDSRTALRNGAIDAGFQYTINLKDNSFTIGGTWNPGVYLSGTQQSSVVNLNLDTVTKSTKAYVQYRLPPNYAGGVSFRTKRSTIAADVRYVQWQNAIMNDFNVKYQNIVKYSMGYEYRGNPNSTRYIGLIAFRAGVFVQDYPVVLNTSFKMWGYNIGLGIPLQNYRASINVNYSFTQLGTTQATLVREQSGKLVLDFIIRDIWGARHLFE